MLFAGSFDCLRQIARSEGIKGLSRGALPYMLREVPYYTIYFVTFEWGKRMLGPDQHPMALFWLGGFCGTYPWVIVYPIDTIKSKMQSRDSGTMTMRQVFRQTVVEHGVRAGLFRGLSAAVMRAFPVHATSFVAYEFCLKQLKKI